LAARPGAGGCVSRGFRTPFILERANPSKDGDAKPWAFGGLNFPYHADGCQVAEGMVRAKSPSVPEAVSPQGYWLRRNPWIGFADYVTTCPALFTSARLFPEELPI
jgi:hypothetical protein